jgi:hypothetical protein
VSRQRAWPRALKSAAALVLFGGLTAATACGGEPTGVVFGVTTEIKPGALLTKLDASLIVDGAETKQSWEGEQLAFPLEIRADDLEGGEAVELTLDAWSGATRILERRATTTAEESHVLIYPVNIDQECAGVSAPTCSEAETCVAGACADPFKDPSKLADYYSGWAGTSGGDRCEPGGAPEVIVGEGQADYLPTSNGDTLQVEAGPQGGYHVWIAARLKNLKQSGSVTEVSGRIAELDYDIAPLSVVFTLDPDEGGYCKLFGLRLRLDDPDHPIESLLGKTVDVTVTVTDPDGDVGVGHRTIVLSDDYI